MNKDRINLIINSILILCLGLLIGFTTGYFQAKRASFPQFQPIGEINPGISTVRLTEYEGGKLIGEVDGRPARIAYSPEHIEDVMPGESFEIQLNEVSLAAYYSALELPENVQYIASIQGKYAYHVLDPRALRITPKNRNYFTSASEVEAAGYLLAE